jgi:hypothetical protein
MSAKLTDTMRAALAEIARQDPRDPVCWGIPKRTALALRDRGLVAVQVTPVQAYYRSRHPETAAGRGCRVYYWHEVGCLLTAAGRAMVST